MENKNYEQALTELKEIFLSYFEGKNAYPPASFMAKVFMSLDVDSDEELNKKAIQEIKNMSITAFGRVLPFILEMEERDVAEIKVRRNFLIITAEEEEAWGILRTNLKKVIDFCENPKK